MLPMNATGYRMGFLLLLIANCIFTLEQFVITIFFLGSGDSQIACARTLGFGPGYCIQVVREVSQQAHLWDAFTGAFERRWKFTNIVIRFTAMCLLLSIARIWLSSHLLTR